MRKFFDEDLKSYMAENPEIWDYMCDYYSQGYTDIDEIVQLATADLFPPGTISDPYLDELMDTILVEFVSVDELNFEE